MILTSLLTLACSLLPMLLGQFDFPAPALWRSCSLFAAIVTLVQLAVVSQSVPESMKFSPFLHQPMPIMLLLLSGASILVQLSISAGALGPSAPAIYSCSVSYLLFLSSYHFFRLIMAVQTE